MSAPSSSLPSLFCSLAANPNSLPKFDVLSCPIAQMLYSSDSTRPETNPWFMFISQIGYTNSHALLCLWGIIAVCLSLSATLKSYSKLTGSASFSALSQFQILNISFHFMLMALFASFLVGFVCNFLNIIRAWPIFSAACEVLLFGLQIILCFISIKSWYTELSGPYRAILNAFLGVFYFIPSFIYFTVVSVHVANGFESTLPLGNLIKYASVMLWVLRSLLAGLFLIRGSSSSLEESREDITIRVTNIAFSIVTITTGILWITFTFNVFCPQLHFQSSPETFILSFLEWSYFTSLSLLLFCLSKTTFNDTDTSSSDFGIPSQSSVFDNINGGSANRSVKFDTTGGRKSLYNVGGSTFSIASSSNNTNEQPFSSSSTLSKQQYAYSSADAMKRLENRWSLSPNAENNVSGSPTFGRFGQRQQQRQSLLSPLGSRETGGYMTPYSRQSIVGSKRPFSVGGGARKSGAVSPGIFSSYLQQDSEATLFDELQIDERQQQLQQRLNGGGGSGVNGNETWGWMFLVDSSAFVFISAAFIGIWYEVVAGRGPVVGCIIGLLFAFSIVIFLQVGLGVFNADHLSDTYRPFMSRKASIPLSLGYITIAFSAALSNSFGFLVVASLWPICLLLCLSSTGKCTTEDRMAPLLQSILLSDKIIRLRKRGGEKLKRNATGVVAVEKETTTTALASPLLASRNQLLVENGDNPFHPAVKRFLQGLAKSCVFHSFLVSVFCGLELPIAISVCLFSILSSAGVASRVGKKKSSIFVGQVNFWAVSLVCLAFLCAVAVLPLYAFPFGKGFDNSIDSSRSSKNVDILYHVSDSLVPVEAIQHTISMTALQGFYLSINVNSTLMGASLGVILNSVQSQGANLMIEADSSLQQLIDISKPFCQLQKHFPIFVAKNFQTIRNLAIAGVPNSAIAYSSPVGRYVPFDSETLSTTSSSRSSFGIEIIATETLLLNPWLPDSARKRSRQMISKPSFNSQFETQGINMASILSGISALVFTNVQTVLKLPNLSSSSSGLNGLIVPMTNGSFPIGTLASSLEQLVTWSDVPFSIKWGAACGIPAFLAFVLGLASFVYETIKRKKKMEELEVRKIAEREARWKDQYQKNYNLAFSPTRSPTPNDNRYGSNMSLDSSGNITVEPILEETINSSKTQKDMNIRRAGARICEFVALIGWFLFALGIGLMSPTYIPKPSVFMYLFGVTGFASCAASFSLVGQSAAPSTILVAVGLNVISLLGSGYIIHTAAQSDLSILGTIPHLAMTGAALFAAAKVASTSLAAARHSRIALELENLMMGLSLVVFLGWLTVAVGMGRFSVDVGSFNGIVANHGIGPIGSIISTAIASLLILFSCWFNVMPVIAVTTGATVVSLVFTGGLLGDTSNACFGYSFWCPSQQLAMLAGGVISIIGLTASLAVRFWSFETEETRRQKLLLKYQIAYSEKLRRRKGKVSVQKSQEVDVPIYLPERPHLFIHISNHKESWRLWKIGCSIALFGWLLFLGGFGASSGFTQDAIAAGMIFTISSPIALSGLTLSVIKDSRILAGGSQTLYHISLLGFGGVLHISSAILAGYNNLATPPAAVPFIIAGSIIYFGASIPVSGGLIYRLKHKHRQYGYAEIKYGSQLLFWIMILSGMSLWISSNTGDTVSIVSSIITSILCAISVSIHLLDDNMSVFSPPSVLSSFPLLVTQISYVELGAAMFKSSNYVGTCIASRSCAGSIAGPILIFVGGLGYFLSMEAKFLSMIQFSVPWQDPDMIQEVSDSETDSDSELSDSKGDSDSDTSYNHCQKSRPKDVVPKSVPLDIHGLFLSWPFLQSIFKYNLFFGVGFIGIVGVSLGAGRTSLWQPEYSGILVLVVVGVSSIVFQTTWIFTGSRSVYYAGLSSSMISLSMSGHAIFWGLTQGAVGYEAGMFVGGLGFGLLSVIHVVLSLSWGAYTKTKSSGDGWTIPTIYQSFSIIGWFIFLVCFGINAKEAGISSVSNFVACLLTIGICPAIAFLYWFSSISNTLFLRIGLYSACLFLIMTTGANLHHSTLTLWETGYSALFSLKIGLIFGALLILVTQVSFLLHRSIVFATINLSPEEREQLVEPGLTDEGVSWIYAPTSYHTLGLLLKMALGTASVTLVCYMIAMGLSDPAKVHPPLAIHYAFMISSFQAIFGLSFHVYFHWTSFGVLGILSCLISFASAGAAIYSLTLSSIELAVTNTAIASSSMTLALLVASIVILLHKPYPPISRDEIFTITHVVLIGMVCVGWLLTVVAVGIRKGGGIPAFLQAAASGGLTMVSLIIEKRRPGFVIHALLRACNIGFCSLSLVLTGVSFASDMGWLVQNGGVGSQIDMAGSSLLIVGCGAYILIIFLHSIKNYSDLYPYEDVYESKSTLYSTQAVAGTLEDLSQDLTPNRDSATSHQSNTSVGTENTHSNNRDSVEIKSSKQTSSLATSSSESTNPSPRSSEATSSQSLESEASRRVSQVTSRSDSESSLDANSAPSTPSPKGVRRLRVLDGIRESYTSSTASIMDKLKKMSQRSSSNSSFSVKSEAKELRRPIVTEPATEKRHKEIRSPDKSISVAASGEKQDSLDEIEINA